MVCVIVITGVGSGLMFMLAFFRFFTSMFMLLSWKKKLSITSVFSIVSVITSVISSILVVFFIASTISLF